MTLNYCTDDQPPRISDRRTAFRYALALLLILPYGYLGMLLAVANHEFVGHGVTAILVGGTFTGAHIEFDGMGSAEANVPPDAEFWKHAAVKIGGVLSTIVAGIALLLLSWRARRVPWIGLPLLVLGANQILEGSPYLCWNAVHPVPPGDIAAIVSHWPLVRPACIVFGGSIMFVGVWCSTAMLMWMGESWLNDGRRYAGLSRYVVLVVLGSVPGFAWFTFDWNQIARGLAAWPNVAGLFIHLVCAASLAPVRWRIERVQPNLKYTLFATAVGWTFLLLAIAVVGIWLRNGVTW